MQDLETLYLLDTSLTKKYLSQDEKITLAKTFEKINIDIIEIPANDKDLASEIVENIKDTTIAVSTILAKDKIDEAINLIKNAAQKRLRLILTPELYEDFDLNDNTNKKDLVKMVKDSITYSKSQIEDIEFIIIINDKIHRLFLFKLIESAAEAGAKTVTIADKEGKIIPYELTELFKETFISMPDIENLIIGTSCNNKLGMASANTVAAIIEGSRQVEVTAIASCISNDSASLQDILRTHKFRKDLLKVKLNLNPEGCPNTCEITKKLLHHIFCET
ncbi:MAG: hypothetical protein AB7V50_11555 [Vampirovibrionia bacterium]